MENAAAITRPIRTPHGSGGPGFGCATLTCMAAPRQGPFSCNSGGASGRHPASIVLVLLALLRAGTGTVYAAEIPQDGEPPIPRYEHVVLIIAENRSAAILADGSIAPRLARLARRYGQASRFFGEVHPSEGNYVAMLAGDTFGIHDDDPWYCKPGSRQAGCSGASQPAYADHTVYARTLVDQLEEHGLSWKAYMESIPEPGSLAVYWPTPEHPVPGVPAYLYAAKHNGFVNLARVQHDTARAARIVGFDQLNEDLAAGTLPNYAQIVPNQCNDMHGLSGRDVPADCRYDHPGELIARGDRVIGELVDRIMRSKAWGLPGHVALVITFDEADYGDPAGPQGCCGYDPDSSANFGGGHIPTLVITNHGPRALVDAHPYNHYSLLRTIESAFGIFEHLGHAADFDRGVTGMSPLFAVDRTSGTGRRTLARFNGSRLQSGGR